MSKSIENPLGYEKIDVLLAKQSVPAAIGFLIMSLNSIVDTIFVGRWIGADAIGGITVVMPITFFIAAIGLAIGIGGGSIISRALGAEDHEKAEQTFGNQILLTLVSVTFLLVVGYVFIDSLLGIFGGKGDILEPAKVYFSIVLFGTPFLAWAMMTNNVIRAEGRAKVAMLTMVFSAIINVILDPIFIIYLDLGMEGAAWATTIAYFSSAAYTLYYFLSGRSTIKIRTEYIRIFNGITREILALGGVTLARQGSVTILSAVLNLSLFKYGGEMAVSAYGIISRLMMFSLFPVMGIVQGFMPIVGFNYGAKNFLRVRETLKQSMIFGTLIATTIFLSFYFFPEYVVGVFTSDAELIQITPGALVLVYMAMPLITLQLLGSAYFQAIGKARPALFLTLTKQGFFLIPLVLILPRFFGLDGIWYSFPISDILATTITIIFLLKALASIGKTEDKRSNIKIPQKRELVESEL